MIFYFFLIFFDSGCCVICFRLFRVFTTFLFLVMKMVSLGVPPGDPPEAIFLGSGAKNRVFGVQKTDFLPFCTEEWAQFPSTRVSMRNFGG